MEMLFDGGSRKLTVEKEQPCSSEYVRVRIDRIDHGDIAKSLMVDMDRAEALAVAKAIEVEAKNLKK